MRAGFPGTEIARLELALLRAGVELPLFNEGTTERSVRLVDIPNRPDKAGLVLSSVLGSTGLTTYQSLSLEGCTDGDCEVEDLQGFPIWSPDGRRSLVLVGPELYIGDAGGTPVQFVDRAFSPFWMTNETFGYVRLLGNESNGRPEMELAIQSAETGEVRPIIKSADLLRQINSATPGALRIISVAPALNDPDTLFLAGTPVAGVEKFYIIKLTLDENDTGLSPDIGPARAEVVLSLDGLPVGDRTTLTPTGYRPFSISPDGRWITVVVFDNPITDNWVAS